MTKLDQIKSVSLESELEIVGVTQFLTGAEIQRHLEWSHVKGVHCNWDIYF